MEPLSPEQQQEHLTHKSFFLEYDRFNRPDSKKAEAEQKRFQDNVKYLPTYDTRKLRDLRDVSDDGSDFDKQKSATLHAIYELDANKDSGVVSAPEYDLAISTHEYNLKKMILSDAARRLLAPGDGAQRQLAKEEYIKMNQELFGEIDYEKFSAMMASESSKLATIIGQSDQASSVIDTLKDYFSNHTFEGTELPLMTDDMMVQFKSAVEKYFEREIGAVEAYLERFKISREDGEVFFSGQGTADVMNEALKANGLYDKGWRAVVDAEKKIVSTVSETKRIYIPEKMNRTIDELKRLIVHEVGIHANRGQKGDESGIYALKVGTANYGDVEEGAGVILECALAGDFNNLSFHRARDRYIVAGLALGADGGPQRDARQTYELAWRIIAVRMCKNGVLTDTTINSAKTQAMLHVDNAFRGTDHAGPGVIYRKLKVYYEGLLKNAEYFTKHSDDLVAALNTCQLGKYDHTDITESAVVDAALIQKAA